MGNNGFLFLFLKIRKVRLIWFEKRTREVNRVYYWLQKMNYYRINVARFW